MSRREFITLLGGAAVAWPLAARAQHQKFFHLGYLEAGAASDRTVQDLRRQFLLGLHDLGYIEGRHFKLEERYAGGLVDRLPALAAELVALPVDMIAANGEAPISANNCPLGRRPHRAQNKRRHNVRAWQKSPLTIRSTGATAP